MNLPTTTRCIVVNYNAGACLSQCIEDLLAQQPAVDIVVVDNASSDGSTQGLSTNLTLIKNTLNQGYAVACNQGAVGARTEFLAFVNPDCRLAAHTIAQLQRALSGSPDAALAGAWICNEDGSEQRATRRTLPSPKRALMSFTGLERFSTRWPALAGVNQPRGRVPSKPLEVEAVNGACFLIRRADFQQLGGFDEAFFLHCEDLDLFKRLVDLGRQVMLVPEVRVVHAGGVPSRSVPFKSHWWKHRAMARYWRKHYARHPTRLAGSAGLWLHYLLALPVVAWRAVQSKSS